MSLFIGWQVNICSWQAVLCSSGRRRNIVHFHCLFEGKMLIVNKNGDNHIQNLYLGRYIARYTFENPVLQISDRISHDIPPHLKILNTVIS